MNSRLLVPFFVATGAVCFSLLIPKPQHELAATDNVASQLSAADEDYPSIFLLHSLLSGSMENIDFDRRSFAKASLEQLVSALSTRRSAQLGLPVILVRGDGSKRTGWFYRGKLFDSTLPKGSGAAVIGDLDSSGAELTLVVNIDHHFAFNRRTAKFRYLGEPFTHASL